MLLLVTILVLPLNVHALCTSPDCVPRDGWDNFANNLGSDLAPFLALFGEQVTTQYMSESLDWVDNILLALAPLGIITILVSAIRVSGTGPLKSLIGRGRETRGEVETDLMSSTSSDACELWSGDGVVRVVGTPALLQLIWIPKKVGDPDKSRTRLYNFRDMYSRNLHYTQKQSDNSPSNFPDDKVNSEKQASGENWAPRSPEERTQNAMIDRNPPNVSLNLSVKSVPRPTLIFFIVLGFIAQGAVLAFAAVSQYVLRFPKNESGISFYAFPVLCAGTVFLSVGILLCAHVVESSTGEITWAPRPDSNADTLVLWLQQGGQKVGDQEFEAFAQTSKEDIISSYRQDNGKSRKELVIVAVVFTLLGFIAQLVGLRAAHSSVTVMQIAAILLVTVFRSSAHFKRNKRNIIEKPQLVEGFELDWLAKYLGGISDWKVDTSLIPAASQQPGTRPVTAAPAASGQPGSLLATGVSATPQQSGSRPATGVPTTSNKFGSQPVTGVPPVPALKPGLQPATVTPVGSEQPESRPPTAILPAHMESSGISREGMVDEETGQTLKYSPQEALEVRSRLAELSAEWNLDLRKSVKTLKTAIETTMNDVYSKMTLKEERLKRLRSSFSWQVPVIVKNKGTSTAIEARELIEINLTRDQTNELDGCSDWEVDEYMLEAVLGLWLSSLIEENRKKEEDGEKVLKNIWHIGPATDTFRREHRVWIRRTTPHKSIKRSDKTIRHFGWPTRREDDESLYVETDRTLEVICTHQLYFMFLHRLAKDVQMVGGKTMKRIEESTLLGEIATQARTTARIPDFKLMNTNLASIATIFKDCDLGTIEEAYCCIIPAFQKIQKPTPPRKDFEDAQKISLNHSTAGEWRSSLDIDIYLNTSLESLGLSQNERNAVEEQLYQRLRDLRENFISECVRVGSDVVLQERMWSGLYLRCKLISPQRPLSSISLDLMVLCLTRYRIKAGYDIQEMHELLSSTIRSLNSDISSEGILEKIKNEDAETFKDPDLLSRFIWVHARGGRTGGTVGVLQSPSTSAQNINTTQLPKVSVDTSSRLTASKVLIEARQKLSYMFKSRAFDKYVSNPTSIKCMAEASVTGTFDSGETGDESLPVDLLLIEGYRTPLQMAAELKNTCVVNRILQFWRSNGGFDVKSDHAAAKDGRTALQAAAGGGDINIVKSLFEAGAPINAEAAETSGRTALQAATEGGHEGIVQFLIANGANVNGQPAPNRGITALEAASARGNIKIADLLLEKGANANPIPSTYGRTPLQAAAEAGHNEVVELLLRHKANINAPPTDFGGRSALQGAAEKGHIKTVELLLKDGALVDELPARESGCTAFHAAVCSGRGDIVEILIKSRTTTPNHGAHSEMRTALYAAVKRGHDEVVKILLDRGAPIFADHPEPDGKTILQATLQSGDTKIIGLILTASFDLEAALDYALREGDDDVTSNLLTNDQLDINRIDSQDGVPALLRAAALNHVEVIEWLVARDGLDVNIKDNNGDTALSIAAKAGFTLIVNKLLGRQYILINHANMQGLTPLTLACSEGHVEVVNALLQNPRINPMILSKTKRTCLLAAVASNVSGGEAGVGVKVESIQEMVEMILGHNSTRGLENYADENGVTPLIIATRCGHTAVVEKLLARKGIDINAKDMQQRTAFSTAMENKNDAILFLLLNDQRLEFDSKALGEYILAQPLLLYEAVRLNAYVLVERLLNRPDIGTQLNTADTLGDRPLSIAVTSGSVEIMRMILEREGIETEFRNSAGETPLMIAVRLKKLDIVKLLLRFESVRVDKTVLSMDTSPDIKKLLKDSSRGTNKEKVDSPAPGSSAAQMQGASPNPQQQSSSRPPSREPRVSGVHAAPDAQVAPDEKTKPPAKESSPGWIRRHLGLSGSMNISNKTKQSSVEAGGRTNTSASVPLPSAGGSTVNEKIANTPPNAAPGTSPSPALKDNRVERAESSRIPGIGSGSEQVTAPEVPGSSTGMQAQTTNPGTGALSGQVASSNSSSTSNSTDGAVPPHTIEVLHSLSPLSLN